MNVFLHVIRHRILCLITLISSLFLSVGAMGQSGAWTDEGNYDKDWPAGHIEDDIYQIRDAGDLAAFARLISEYQNRTIQVTSDIDLSAHYWLPIGHAINSSPLFTGIFDGGKHTISNVYIDITPLKSIGSAPDILKVGLFRENSGTIRNVNLENVRITGTSEYSRYMIGGLAGMNDKSNNTGLIEDCTVSGNQGLLDVTLPDSHGEISIGGIAGNNTTYSYIKNCISNIPISFTPSKGGGVSLGGIVGNADGFVIGCSNKKAMAGDCSAIGGIAGTSEPSTDLFGYIEDCSNYGDITNIRGASAGGIVGSGSRITRCFNAGNVTSAFKAAGIVGNMPLKNTKDITYCYNSGSVSVNLGVSENTDSEAYCGGIVAGGGVFGISNCYNTGRLSMKPSSDASNVHNVYIGGIAANIGSYLMSATLTNCYNIADIIVTTSGNCNAGGIVGGGSIKEISSCYNTGKIAVESTKQETVTAVGISSNKVTYCLSLAKDKSVPFITSIGGKESKAYRLTSSGLGCDNNYANAPMLLQLGDKTYTASESVSKNDANGANWEDADNTGLPISNWADDAWDKSDNTILPQLKYADGALMPDQPRLLKSEFETTIQGEPEEPAVSVGDMIITNNFKYEILTETAVSLVGLDLEDGVPLTDCTILSTVSYGGKKYNLTTIGESAFYGCEKLVKITLPDGLKTISKNAFKHCYALTSIDIPASVEAIGQYAFDMDEKLTQVTLREGLKEIGEGAFNECDVKEITIPASVTLLGYLEDGVNNPDIGILERINVQPGNTVYASVDGILYNKAKTILMHCPSDYPVKNVTLPEGLIRIVDNAMEYCGFIESLVLPEGLEVIEIGAFEYCDALKSITIPSTLKEVGSYLFGTPYSEDDFCALQEIHSNHKAPGNIKMDGDPLATVNKNTCTLYVPKSTKALYAAAPGWKDFQNIVEEGGGMTVQTFTVGQLQYKVTAANEVMITGVTDKTPEYFDIKPSVTYEGTTYNVTAVGERAFYGCRNLVRFQPEKIKMPLKTIGKEAFMGCGKLTNLLLGSTLEKIGDGAFMQCSSLQNLEIPAGVASIGEGVFDECVKLTHIAVSSANRHYTSSNGVLYNKDKTILLVCPNMRGDSYIIPKSVKRIESGAFYYCTNLKSVALPDGLESIGDCAFDSCTGLESLTLPAGLKSIGMGIVDHCEKTLKEIHSKMVQPLPLGEYPEYAFFYYSKQSDICALYVPKGSKDSYSKAAGWKNFKRIVEEGESMNPEVPEVTDSTLTVVWEPVIEATDYILKIYRNAAKTELIATYTFDANGKLKSTGFSYQLKGLEAGSTYYIETIAVKQIDGGTVVLAQSMTVAQTTGSSVDNEEVSVNKPHIRISDGQIWVQSPLETEVRIYNLSGYCVCAKRISGASSIRLSSGMYIVLIGEERYKIVIR